MKRFLKYWLLSTFFIGSLLILIVLYTDSLGDSSGDIIELIVSAYVIPGYSMFFVTLIFVLILKVYPILRNYFIALEKHSKKVGKK